MLAIEMKKIKVEMNTPIYLGLLSVLETSKTLMFEFWYVYVEPKYQQNAKLCYMDIGTFIIHIKTKDVYKDNANYAERRFNTSDYDVSRPLPIGKNEKMNGLVKNELGGKIMTEVVALRSCLFNGWW